jgi:phosphopantothenoylcysteine decarboxylase
MPNLLLGVTGSVAAIKTPNIVDAFRLAGWTVKVVATQHSLYFFDPLALDLTREERNPDVIVLDEDEWPGHNRSSRYERGDPVLHIELRRWADLFLIAPLDANTLAKLAAGICDNCLTCVWRAWDLKKPVVVAPAMNTLMWEHPATRKHLSQLAEFWGIIPVATATDADDTIQKINECNSVFRIVSPIRKELACGDWGQGAMADLEEILRQSNSLLALSQRSS